MVFKEDYALLRKRLFLVTAAFDRMVLGTFLKDTKPELTPGLANLLMGIYGNDISSHETLLNKVFLADWKTV